MDTGKSTEVKSIIERGANGREVDKGSYTLRERRGGAKSGCGEVDAR